MNGIPRFRKSSRSPNGGGNCVEVATNVPGRVFYRDIKNPTGPVLTFTPEAHRVFITALKHGDFDR